MTIIILGITFFYLLLIGSFIYGFDKTQDFKIVDRSPHTKFSVIIPFRNEANQLPNLLDTIKTLEYPKSMFEIIMVDDDSSDNSVNIIKNYDLKGLTISVVKNIRRTASPKKDAITTAIANAQFNWIITSDADCSLPKYWLDIFDNYIQNEAPKLIIAPVTYTRVNSFFKRFQLLDILSLQGATIGSFGIGKPIMCNGANLAYQKDVFTAINGYEGNSHVASGDDLFILEKLLKTYKKGICYLKHRAVIVSTNAEPNFSALKSQRIRWASKTATYHNNFSKLTAIIVIAMNGLVVCLPLLYYAEIITLKTVMYTCMIKFLIDFLLIFKSARFFEQGHFLSAYILSCLLYPYFTTYIACLSVFKGYKWKSRRYGKYDLK